MALAVPLVTNTSILKLNLRDNRMEGVGGAAVADMLKENWYITGAFLNTFYARTTSHLNPNTSRTPASFSHAALLSLPALSDSLSLYPLDFILQIGFITQRFISETFWRCSLYLICSESSCYAFTLGLRVELALFFIKTLHAASTDFFHIFA